ncbi:MAG: PAS domain-containing protein [Christensenellaceae bacterium]
MIRGDLKMDDLNKNGYSWLFTPEVAQNIQVTDEKEFFNSPALFNTILESIQDGVSVLDSHFTVKYVNATMRHIYAETKDVLNKKCYEVYHNRTTKCEKCPTMRAIKTHQPQTDIVQYTHKSHAHGVHQLFAIPVLNAKGEVILIIEYIRDITFQNSVVDNLRELEKRFEALEQQNEMLTQVLSQREQYRDDLEETISTNMQRFIKPSLDYLKKSVRPQDIDLVNGLIDEIIYPITKKRSSAVSTLTPREIQVATFIKDGFTSKEISDKLCVTQKAVDYHRLNIRKKLKLKREQNLRSYLETHF